MNDDCKIGLKIKQIRKDCNLNQADFAASVGLSHQSHLSKVEKGESSASIAVLKKISALSRLPIDYIVCNPIATKQSLIGLNYVVKNNLTNTILKNINKVVHGVLELDEGYPDTVKDHQDRILDGMKNNNWSNESQSPQLGTARP